MGNKGENLLQWVNFVLSRKNMRATNAEKDFADGTLLWHLVSTLSKKNVGKIKENKVLTRFDQLGNLTVVFNFMAREGIKLSNIGPEDVVAGNVKLIQGLIWTLINFYFVEVDLDDEAVTAHNAAAGGDTKNLTPKQRLLEWVKFVANSYPGVKVTNWKSSFEDGLALCALVHFHHPRELDFYALNREDAMTNVTTVMKVLETRWGIPKFVDPADLLSGRADEEMILTLVATCKRELKNAPTVDSTGEAHADAAAGVVVDDDSLLESRKALRRVVEHAEHGQRKETDDALAAVLKIFRATIQSLEDAQASSSAERREKLQACRLQLDRGLRDLMQDAVLLCRSPQSALHRRLARRDMCALCAAESETARLLSDDTDSSRKALNDRMRVLRVNKEPARIMQVSKLLEEENIRLAGAAKNRVQSKASHLESRSAQVAQQMVAELELQTPRFAPLAARLAEDPNNRETQKELAELNREISNIVADLDLTLEVDASQELHALNAAVRAAFLRFRTERLEGCAQSATTVSHRCQAALSAVRKMCTTLPKSKARAVLALADALDETLSLLLQAVGTATAAAQLEHRLQALKNAAEELTQVMTTAEAEQRRDSAVPEVKQAVAGVLVAIRQADKSSMTKRSNELTTGGNRAVDLATARKANASNPALVDDFVRDLKVLQPLHVKATAEAAAADKPDRGTLRRVAETARDVLSVVLDLEEASRPAPELDEFASLQSLMGAVDVGAIAFDLVTETRDVADSARQSLAHDPYSVDAADLLATIQELEAALPTIVAAAEDGGQDKRDLMKSSVPKLERAVHKHHKERVAERAEEPHDDLVRLARYARAGVKNDRIREIQGGVKAKSDKYSSKKKAEAAKMADPIRQQRIMEAATELDAMAPLQLEAFQRLVAEPELEVLRDEFAELSLGLAGASGTLGGLFPDLLLVTPIDLDSAIQALQEETRSADDDALPLRAVDMTTLRHEDHAPSASMMPEMLQLDALEAPPSRFGGESYTKQRERQRAETEALAQSVVEALADDGDADAETLAADALAAELDAVIALSAQVAHTVTTDVPANPSDGALVAAAVRDVITLVRRAKVAAASMGDVEAAPVMFAELEELANRAAAMVFAVNDFNNADVALDELTATCAAVARQAQTLSQLAASQAALLAVATFEVPSAEDTLGAAHAQLDRVWRQDDEGSSGSSVADEDRRGSVGSVPDAACLAAVARTAKGATFEWRWDDFVRATSTALTRVKGVLRRVQDAGRRVLLQQAGESMLGRAKQLLSTSVHKPRECRDAVRAVEESVEALQRVCDALDARAFRAVRSVANCPDAAAIQAALMDGVANSPKQGEIFLHIRAIQDRIPALSTELRNFKAKPTSFTMSVFRAQTVGVMFDSGVVRAGLEDDATRNLLQGIREQLADAGAGFVYAVLDVLEFPGADTSESAIVALKKLSLVLVQLAKWTSKAVSTLQPPRTAASDPDASRIMRQLKALRDVETLAVTGTVSKTDLMPARGIVTSLGDALGDADRQLRAHEDAALVSDAVVHVVLLVGSLAKHYGHDVHVGQLCSMAELLGHATFDVVFRIRDLALPVGNERLVDEAARNALDVCVRMRDKTAVLSSKLVKLADLYVVVGALESCEALLAEPLPVPPRVSNANEFERALKPETGAVISHCNRVGEPAFDFAAFSGSVVSAAGVVRNNASVLADGADSAKVVRLTMTLVGNACKALLELATAASCDSSSEAFHSASTRMREDARSVALLASRLEELVAEAASYASATTSAAAAAAASAANSASGSTATPQKRQSWGDAPRGQTLIVGKSLTACIVELSKGQTAQFSTSDAVPSGLAGSLTMLPGAEERIDALLQRGAGPELQRTLSYFMNLLKHLASGYLKDDSAKLGELVQQCKAWASRVILTMKAHEEEGKCDTGPAKEALRDLHKFVVSKVVLCCGACQKAISGSYTTADGLSFHDSCFVCVTCGKPIQGSYFREGSSIYCSDDLPMTNSLVCTRCNESVEYGTNYLEVKSMTFHRECFSCFDCNKPLSAARFFISGNEIRCEEHAT